MDDDLGRPGRIITTPVAFGRRRAGKKIGQPLRPSRKFLREIRAAAEDNYGANGGKDWGNLRDFHSEADVSPIVGQCNGQWHLGNMESGDAHAAISMPWPTWQKGDRFVAGVGKASRFDAARGWHTLG
jgi:hypothetical protein